MLRRILFPVLFLSVTSVYANDGVESRIPRAEPQNHMKAMKIAVQKARIVFLTPAEHDIGRDLTFGTSDDGAAGPFFVVIGDITSVDDQPATGTFVCRGVVFTEKAPPQKEGTAQVNVTFDIDGRGILYGQSIEFKSTTAPTGAILGGTGEFERFLGTYTPSGAPAPLGDGNFTFTLQMRRAF